MEGFLTEAEKKEMLELFLSLVKINSASRELKEDEKISPSTPEQRELAEHLKTILVNLGMEVEIDENGYLTACLPANTDKKVPTVAFLAHLDTYPGVPGKANPQIIENYNGEDIILPGNTEKIIRVKDCPTLTGLKGQTIITTDGTTLLGADDKAGIVEIITAIKWLLTHPEVEHGKILISFTPDEEIGGQAQHLDLSKFKADFAFTVDGENPGDLTIATFCGYGAKVTIEGQDAHPGMKGELLINAIHIATKFLDSIPATARPETTYGSKNGFIHPMKIEGDVSKVEIFLILRDFQREKTEALGEFLKDEAKILEKAFPGSKIKVETKFSYPNMMEELEKHPEIIKLGEDAISQTGITMKHRYVRGGTDGSSLTLRGLPCPDIFAGTQNAHSHLEWTAPSFMAKSVHAIINVVKGTMKMEKKDA